MSEAEKSYELKILKTVINIYLDESTSVTEEGLAALENNCDQVVWGIATSLYSQSGHKVELSTVLDEVNSRIEFIKGELARKKRIIEHSSSCPKEKDRNFASYTYESEVFNKVKEILINQLGIDEDKVTPTSHIASDLDADECDTIQISLDLEDEFDIEIPSDMLGSVKKWPPSYSSNSFGDYNPVACTVCELVEFIYQALHELA